MAKPDNSDFDPLEDVPGSADALVSGDDGASAGDSFEPQGSDTIDARLGELERRLTEQQDRYLRLAAEYDNYRKRTVRERADLESRAQGDLVRQLLDGLDDLSRFAHVDPASVDAVTIAQGVEMVEKKMQKALTGAGLEILDPVNQSFDPKLHEAVATEPALSPEDDHVVSRVFQAGYLFNGQLLRPARVVVKQWNG